jgi:hypothetical protein
MPKHALLMLKGGADMAFYPTNKEQSHASLPLQEA